MLRSNDKKMILLGSKSSFITLFPFLSRRFLSVCGHWIWEQKNVSRVEARIRLCHPLFRLSSSHHDMNGRRFRSLAIKPPQWRVARLWKFQSRELVKISCLQTSCSFRGLTGGINCEKQTISRKTKQTILSRRQLRRVFGDGEKEIHNQNGKRWQSSN